MVPESSATRPGSGASANMPAAFGVDVVDSAGSSIGRDGDLMRQQRRQAPERGVVPSWPRFIMSRPPAP